MFGLAPARAVDFAKNYGASGGAAQVYSTTADQAGNVYIAGVFDSAGGATFDVGEVTLTRLGQADAFVAKLDASGNTLWAKNFGGPGASMHGRGVAVDGDGNVYLGGHSHGNLSSPAMVGLGATDAFAIKLDALGNTLWAKNFGGLNTNSPGLAIAVDHDGNAYLGGHFSGESPTTPTLTKLGDRDAFAIKMDTSGNVIWAKNFGGAGADTYAFDIAADSDGNAYLTGSFGLRPGYGGLSAPVLPSRGDTTAFAIKLDASGGTTWARSFGGSGAFASGEGIAVDSVGNVFLSGEYGAANLTAPPLTVLGNQDVFAIKLDADGATVWAKGFGGNQPTTTFSRGIRVDGAGNAYVGGFFYLGNLIAPSMLKMGDWDAFALRLDVAGNVIWTKHIGGSGSRTVANAIGVGNPGNVYLGGYFSSGNLTSPPLNRIGDTDAFVAKFGTSGDLWWDVFWRKSDGTNSTWQFTGPAPTHFASAFPPGVSAAWDVKGTGDMNGDGVPDVVWFDPSSGQVAIWLMSSPAAIGGATYPASVGAGSPWVLSGVGDVNGDGRADLVWRHGITGEVLIWYMSATGTISNTTSLGTVSLTYQIRGVGDFNGDGRDDILWIHPSDGVVVIYLMNSNGTFAGEFPGAVGAGSWRPYKIGDFDGDGKADIFWRNEANGMTAAWYMNGGAIAASDFFVSVPMATWQLGSAGDFDLDGRSDLMWYAPSSGGVSRWMMQGRHVAPVTEVLPGVGTGWQMVQ